MGYCPSPFLSPQNLSEDFLKNKSIVSTLLPQAGGGGTKMIPSPLIDEYRL